MSEPRVAKASADALRTHAHTRIYCPNRIYPMTSLTAMTSCVNSIRDGAILVLEIDSPPVNSLSQSVRRELLDALTTAHGDATVEAVVLCAAGRTFVAGADITEFDANEIAAPDPNDLFDVLERFGRPVVAALHGTVLGGGLELALAAHHRIALDSTKLGLPEVTLGVLPGSGGTQRLPRLTGVLPALDMMTRGSWVNATEARALGIVDAVVQDGLRVAAVETARRLAEAGGALRVTSRMSLDQAQGTSEFFASYRLGLPSRQKGGRAAHAIVDCVESAMALPFGDALRQERTAFDALRVNPESVALRHIFFAEREATRIPGLPRDVSARTIHRVGVVGAGTMGGGIAMTFANAGFSVTLVEVQEQALQRGVQAIRKSYEAAVARKRLTHDEMEHRLSLISGSLDDRALAACDLVVEAVYENLAVKEAICRRLGEICKRGAIIATNTSTLNVDTLAEATGRPQDVVGMHFFSPAHVMKLLEVVRGAHTAPDVLATVMVVAKKLGKAAVVSGVCYGFIGNRMLEGYLREAEFLLMEGASPSQIDSAIEDFGMAMGPCRMIDMAGVDVAAKVVIERGAAGNLPDDPSYRAVVQRLNAMGRFGQKAASGYYRYEGRSALADPEVDAVCRELAQQHGIARREAIPADEIVERCIYPLINEGAQALEEGIAYRPGDVDVVWVHGYGFPAFKGGPMHLASAIGPEVIKASLDSYAAARGNHAGYWTASEGLKRLGA